LISAAVFAAEPGDGAVSGCYDGEAVGSAFSVFPEHPENKSISAAKTSKTAVNFFNILLSFKVVQSEFIDL
jgi:hypothetical protein